MVNFPPLNNFLTVSCSSWDSEKVLEHKMTLNIANEWFCKDSVLWVDVQQEYTSLFK